MIGVLRSLGRFLDRLPGGGVPWTPGARRAYFATNDMIERMRDMHHWMDEATRSAVSDGQGGSGRQDPRTIAAVDRVDAVTRSMSDRELSDLVSAWRAGIDTSLWAPEPGADGEPALKEPGAGPSPVDHGAVGSRLAAPVYQRLAALMDQLNDREHEVIEAHPVRVVRIDDEDLELQDAQIEINRTRGAMTWVWRLDGVLTSPMPTSLRSGRFCDLWAPIGSLGAFTGRGVLTADGAGAAGGDATRLLVDGLEYRIV